MIRRCNECGEPTGHTKECLFYVGMWRGKIGWYGRVYTKSTEDCLGTESHPAKWSLTRSGIVKKLDKLSRR